MTSKLARKELSPNGAEAESRGVSDFPKHTLQQALAVANALENKNGGNPLSPTDVAIALGKSPQSSTFRDLLSSSFKYGLTAGSYKVPKITLAELGKDIVEPKSDSAGRSALLKAGFKPALLKRVYEHYKNRKLPDPQFFKNVLVRDFDIAKDQAERFVSVFLANVEHLGMVKNATTGKFLGSLEDGVAANALGQHHNDEQPLDEDESQAGHQIESAPTGTQRLAAITSPPMIPTREQKNAIFVGHGNNKTPLHQLEKILTEYKLPHKIAVEEPNSGRPISQKVADIMNECGAAIIVFTADQEFRDLDGEVVYRPSENAVFELGAASALYGARIVIFKEATVQFPSNFRDIGYIEFDKNQLGAKVNELFRELIGFGLIKVSVAGV